MKDTICARGWSVYAGGLAVCASVLAGVDEAGTVWESPRAIPVVTQTEVLVVGGSSAAVAAAEAAAKKGANVFLVAPRAYLGDDMAGTLRLWLEPGEQPDSSLAKRVFGDRRSVTPGQLKSALDAALLEAGVAFLTHSPVVAVLRDDGGRVAGVAVANRSGLQALPARVVIDATEHATVARLAGAKFAGWQSGTVTFERVAVGGPLVETNGVTGRTVPTEIAGYEGGGRAVKKPLPAKPAPAGAAVSNAVRRSSVDAVDMTLDLIATPRQHDPDDGLLAVLPQSAGSGAPAAGVPRKTETSGSTARALPVHVHSVGFTVSSDTWRSWMEAENLAMDRAMHPQQQDFGDSAFFVPPDNIKSDEPTAGAWRGAGELALKSLRPAGTPHVWVLGGYADIPRPAAAAMLRPAAFMAVGARAGAAAADEAQSLPEPKGVHVAKTGSQNAGAEVKGPLTGLRPFPTGSATVRSEGRALPVLGGYDVVVVGGGTGGAPAGIGAGRAGAKVLLIEFQHRLGGVGTVGMIGKYYHGNRVGFTAEVDAAVAGSGSAVSLVGKTEWWRKANRDAGVEVWFGCTGYGAVVEGKTVKGIVVATPMGDGVVLARTVIDATGNADIAAAAGAETEYTAGEELAVQGAGVSPRSLGVSYANADQTFADDTDALDLWHFQVVMRRNFTGYDISPIVNTRERRRIVGDHTLTPMDLILNRTFPDTVVQAKSNFDSHGFTVHPLFMMAPPDHAGLTANVPFRCLLPRGFDGILVTGLGIGAHRDAMPVVRMQPDVQNQGYAAGVAATMAAKAGTSVRKVDIKALQAHLVEKGILASGVPGSPDSFPLPPERIEAAVKNMPSAKGLSEVSVLLAHTNQAMPLLRAAYKTAGDDTRLRYAHLLGLLGDPSGVKDLMEAVEKGVWDKGWNFRGMGQFGASMSPLDSLIIALGRTRSQEAMQVLLSKASELDSTREFSHHRAIALALEAMRDKSAAPVLAAVLAKTGMSGYAITDINAKNGLTLGDRTARLREIYLARALYRCGDHEGLGEKILRQYEGDLRGQFARHAHAVLSEKSRDSR